MNKTNKVVLATLYLAIAVLSVTACGHRHYDQEHRSQWIIKRISEKLDLNDAQQEKLKAVKTEIQAGLSKYQDQQKQLLDRIIKDVQEPAMNKELLMEAVESRQKVYNDIAPHVVDKIIDFQASLNADQKKKLAEYIEHWRDHIEEHK